VLVGADIFEYIKLIKCSLFRIFSIEKKIIINDLGCIIMKLFMMVMKNDYEKMEFKKVIGKIGNFQAI
jgi:hypothetical protein